MPSYQFQIRAASNKDLKQILALIIPILKNFGLEYSPGTSESDLLDIESSYWRSGGTFDVLINDQQDIIGTVALTPIDKHTVKLRKMYVHPDFRKKGLGKFLLDHAIVQAKKRNFQEIRLETVHFMRAAIQLYRSSGFEAIDTKVTASPRCDLVMSKILH